MVVKKGGMVVDTLHKCTCICYSQLCWAWGGVQTGSMYLVPCTIHLYGTVHHLMQWAMPYTHTVSSRHNRM